jgi:single-stranded-DNA-specific exonuclease
MLSVSGKNWEEFNLNKRIIEKVKIEKNFSDIISKIIISRNFDDTELYSIKNSVEILNPFLNNKDFLKGVKLLEKSLNDNKKILVLGDYDVDGCVSTSLFVKFFQQIDNKSFLYYIPNRFKDGYGASLSLIKRLVKQKPDLIIMVDCGSNSSESINYLNKKNIKTIIIDHHEIYKPYPNAECIINPKKDSDYQKFDYFCASTLTYFFIDTYIKKNLIKINFKENLIYVLLSTICDVMPLRKINRIIAINVLKDGNIKNNFLFNKIFSLKQIKRPLQISDFGFIIGPILNSAGRLTDPNKIVKLLTIKDNKIKDKIIKELIDTNEKRKKIETDSIKEINLEKIKNDSNNVLIHYKNIINEGIIGIIASRLKEFFNKPSIVLTKSGNLYKASARSTENFNIGKFIKQAIDKKIIIRGGGHNLAAGFTIKSDKILIFKNFINSMYLKKRITHNKFYLSKISLTAINNNFFNDLIKMGPFGQDNPNPLFLVEKVRIIKPRILNAKYISFFVKSNSGKLFPAIYFDFLESDVSINLLNNKNEMNLIVQIKENLWNNKKNLQLIVLDMIHLPNKA